MTSRLRTGNSLTFLQCRKRGLKDREVKGTGEKVMRGTRRELKRVKGTKRRKDRKEERTGKIGEDGSSSGKKKR